MRSILVTDRIVGIAKAYNLEMENAETFKKGESPKERLLALSKKLKRAGTVIKILKQKGSKGHPSVYICHKGSEFTAPSEYVKAIYDNYSGLNSLLPSERKKKLDPIIDPILAGYDINEIKVKLPRKGVRPFFELVVEAMRYDRVQSFIMPKYIRKVGIKTCVYCNAQFSTTASIQEVRFVKRNLAKLKDHDEACYELDHNKPKSKYPYLCTNFYNLQPSCSSCNRRKNDKELDFSLYYEKDETDIEQVHFALAPDDIINFRTKNKCKDVKPFLCNQGTDIPPVIEDDTTKAGVLNHMLGIQDIYNEHEDVVEDILWKHKIYSKGFMTATIAQIKSLGLEGFDMKRFVLGGYYGRENDFLKRPLSILKNDLWEQLNKTVSKSI